METIYLSMGGIQPYNDFVANIFNARRFDTRIIKFPFNLRYFKAINLFLMPFVVPRADVYICEAWWDVAFATAKKMLGSKSKVVMLWVFPLGIEYEQMPFLKRALLPIQRFLTRYIDMAVTDSEMNMRDAKAVCQNPDCKFVMAYPFVNPEVFDHHAKDLNNNWFVNVSRDTEEKGLRNLEGIFKKLPKYELTILNQFCREPKKDGNILTHGKVPDFHDYLQIFSFYPTYPNYECFGVAQLECMALGIIPLVGGKCGLAEVLRANDLDCLVATSKSGMAKKIKWAASSNLAEREVLSDKVREIAKTFTKERTRLALLPLTEGIVWKI